MANSLRVALPSREDVSMLIIRLLGAQAVLDGATGRIRTGSSRTLALLGVLIAHTGRPQDRTTIAGEFWPESGDGQALTNLRRELHDLRRILGEDDSLEITTGQLCWHDRGRHDIDLSTFLRESAVTERAPSEVVVTHGSTALEQYGGPLLPGLDDEWLEPLRSELEQRCTALCQRVYRAARATGRTDVAMAALGKLLTVDRFNESAHRALIQLHADSGDRAGAISAYHRLATLLERELGVAPASATTALMTQLLGDTARLGSLSAPDKLDIAEPDLVGRTAELSTLLASWHDASAGRARVLTVHGGAGVGKSRLVSELVRQARADGTLVGRSVCFDTGGRLSLAPVADWLRHPELIAARGRLRPEWIAEVDRLVPGETQTAVQPERSPGIAPTEDVWQRHRFFEAVARTLLAPARPLLLVLDNLQWSDPDTLSFIRFLLNFAPQARLLLASTVRSGARGLDPTIETWLGQIRDEGLLTDISLGPLDGAETTALAAALTGRRFDAAEAKLLYDATGGFPLYVVEAARSVAQDQPGGPPGQLLGWMGILPKRIQQLSPAGREVAGLAAALGRDFSIPLLAEASDLDVETVVVAVDELWRRRIIRQLGDRYDFSHDLLRSTAYDAVTPAKRWLLHRRLAQALELLWSGHTDTVAAQIAEQYRLAGNPERALRYFQRAAEVAAAMFAHGDAVTFLTAARDLLASMPDGRDRDERELTLLELSIPPLNALHGYSSPPVREACERSVNLADELDLTARMVTAMVGLWSSRFVEGRLQDSFELAQKAVNLVRLGDERFGQAHFSLAGSALHLGQPLIAMDHFAIALAAMGDESLSVGTRARVHTGGWWAHACWTMGDFARAADLAAEATAYARASGHRYSLVVGRAFEAITHQLLDDRSKCAEAASHVRAMCKRYQLTYYDKWGQILEGWAHGGRVGLQLIEGGLSGLRAENAHVRMPYWLSLLAQTTSDQEYARQTLQAAVGVAQATGESWWVPELLRLQAAHLTGADRHNTLARAADLARAQNSPAMVSRCEADMDQRSLGHAAPL
jgi:DNA-binding SARP family transcriptional activator/tetratricopeptide (TPR) repeat protein